MNNREELTNKEKNVLEYCKKDLDKMWAASIASEILECDFRDVENHEYFKVEHEDNCCHYDSYQGDLSEALSRYTKEMSKEQDYLIFKFLKENPHLNIDQIEIHQEETSDGFSFYVRERDCTQEPKKKRNMKFYEYVVSGRKEEFPERLEWLTISPFAEERGIFNSEPGFKFTGNTKEVEIDE